LRVRVPAQERAPVLGQVKEPVRVKVPAMAQGPVQDWALEQVLVRAPEPGSAHCSSAGSG
jgi:hypothetical protein